MICNFNKRILLILAVLSILLVLPTTFAEDTNNDTLSIDYEDSLTVDNNIIYVDDGENDGDGSYDNPYNSISRAVNEYNSSVNSKIYIKSGNYNVNQEIELNKDINIVGESSKTTILDANMKGSIFKITAHSNIFISGLTLINSNSSAALNIANDGKVNIDDCIFENNSNGAIYHLEYFSDLELRISSSLFINNFNKLGGGAVYMYYGTSLNVTNSIFKNNRAPVGENDSSDGGAIYCLGNVATLYVDDCKFINNTATKGSAISQYYTGNVYIYNSLFENNTSPGSIKYKVNSSVIYDSQDENKGFSLFLKDNTIRNNNLNDEIFTQNVKVVDLGKNTRITANNVEKILGDDFNFIVQLTDSDGNPLGGKEIISNFTNTLNNNVVVVSNITDSNGRATIFLNNFKPGKYNVKSSFAGDGTLDSVETTNFADIRTENEYNLIINPDHIEYTEGDSYEAVIYIYDEYMMPTNDANGQRFAISWLNYYNRTTVLQMNSIWVEGNVYTFDINRCHLITQDKQYVIYFNLTNYGSANLTVDMSKNLSNIDESLDTLYVAVDGSDENGTGSKDKPLATVQHALIAANYFNIKTVVVGEGTYEFSTFTILSNVTVIGEKSKTILKQGPGKLGMFEIDNGNTVNLVNITFINGFATPEPEGLIHVCDDSVLYVDGCEFSNNSAIDGSAIAISTGGSAYIYNSYFHNNTAYLSRIGGAIYVDRGYLYVNNSVFENNVAGEGGAIFLGFPAEADIVDSTFIGNNATGTAYTTGGGGAIFTRSNNLKVVNSTFINNYANEGGAIFIDYGATEIYKSYFENNRAGSTGNTKGTAVQGSYISYCNLTMHYSILISDEWSENYLVYMPNIDENYTADTQYNYWKSYSSTSNAEKDNQVKILITPSNEFVYTGDIIEFDVEFINDNAENGTSELTDFVHDFALKVIPSRGSVDKPVIIIKNNKAKFLYSAENIGKETIYFENIFNHTKYSFNVEDGSDKIKINATVGFDINKTTTITIDLDAPLNDNITIRVGNVDQRVYVDGNHTTFKINTTPGEYEVNIIFSGNEVYRGFSIIDSFIVDKYPSFVEAANLTVYYNGKFEAKLVDGDGNPIAGEKLIVIIDKQYSASTDENGIAKIDLNLPSVGKYDVTTKFNGNSMYLPSNATSTLTVEFTNVKLTPEKNVVITPLEGKFSFTLTDEVNNTIKNVDVIIVIENINKTVKTNDDGVATIDLENNMFSIGSHEISAEVRESAVYGSTNIKSSLTVNKADAFLNASDVTVFEFKGEFTAQLTDSNGNPISNQTVIFELDGQTKNVTTDGNGTASLKLELFAGNYTVVVKLKENNIYQAREITSKIHVKEDNLIIDAPDVVVYYSQGKFTVTLHDEEGRPITNQRIIVNINNNDYIATTDGNGVAVVNINLPIGVYRAITRFDGNDDYKAGNVSSKITVLSSIESEDMTRAYNSPYDFKAVLKDINGNPVANKTVELIVNGKTYNSTTDANGTLLLCEKLAVGTYAITVTNPATDEKTANYVKIVQRITGNKNVNMYFGAGTSYKVRVFDDNGNPVGKGVVVKMLVNKKSVTVKTDKNGYATYKINLKPGKYTVTATYNGVKVSNKIVVKPVLTAKNISKKKAKKIKFKAKLVNTKGKALKGKKITFKIKGKTYKAKTNKKGIATLTLKKLKVGKYTIKTTYGKSTIKNTIKIKK